MVYNQQIKIHELMLENSGLAVDIASLSQTAVRNSYHASQFASGATLAHQEGDAMRRKLL